MEEEGLTPPLLRNRNVNWGRLQESLNSDNVLPTAISAPSWIHEYLENEYGHNDEEDDDDGLIFTVQHNDEALEWINRWMRRPGSIVSFDASGFSLADRASAMANRASAMADRTSAMGRYTQDIQNNELRYVSARELLTQRDVLGLRHFTAEVIGMKFRGEDLQTIKDCFIHRQPFHYDIPILEMTPVGTTRHAVVNVEVRTTQGDNCTQILLDGNPIIYWTASQASTPYLREGYPITVEYNYLKMEKYYLDIFMRICQYLNLTLYLFRDGITVSRWPEWEHRQEPLLEDYIAGVYRTYFMSDRMVRDYIYREIRNERRRRAPQKG